MIDIPLLPSFMFESVNTVGKPENTLLTPKTNMMLKVKMDGSLHNVSVLVPAFISHCSQERCISL